MLSRLLKYLCLVQMWSFLLVASGGNGEVFFVSPFFFTLSLSVMFLLGSTCLTGFSTGHTAGLHWGMGRWGGRVWRVFWGYCFWAFVGSLSFGVEYFVRDVLSFSCLYAIISLKPSILYLTELSIYPSVCGRNVESLCCAIKLPTSSHKSVFYFILLFIILLRLKIVSLNVKGCPEGF